MNEYLLYQMEEEEFNGIAKSVREELIARAIADQLKAQTSAEQRAKFLLSLRQLLLFRRTLKTQFKT